MSALAWVKFCRFATGTVGVFVLSLLLGNKVSAQEVDYKSYSLFVYNFAKYIEWPEESSKGDFVIGVYGDSPVLKELQQLAATKKTHGRTIVIRALSKPEEMDGCHLVYIVDNKSKMLKKFSEYSANKPILIVAEREGLAKKGAAISFATMEDDVLKFEISKKTLEKHTLKAPNVLLSLGLVVD